MEPVIRSSGNQSIMDELKTQFPAAYDFIEAHDFAQLAARR